MPGFHQGMLVINSWIKDPKNKVKDNDKKINITLSYIEGDKVSNFIQNIYNHHLLKEDEEWMILYVSLMKKLNKWFLEVSHHEDAHEAFDWIKMMPGEWAKTFFEHFDNLDEKRIMTKIEKAVKIAIIVSIYNAGNLPKTYQQ